MHVLEICMNMLIDAPTKSKTDVFADRETTSVSLGGVSERERKQETEM